MRLFILTMLLWLTSATALAGGISASDSLAIRVTEGTSAGRIIFREMPCDSGDRFMIIPDKAARKVIICGNSPVSRAVALNRYLRDVAGIHICWNNLRQPLPSDLPLPSDTITGFSDKPYRYYLNYCTFSYSTPFWDEERWIKEIDWMALHGINMPLAVTGTEKVWQNVLRRLGYPDRAIGEFIAGPAYSAWWLMNNLEGWGGPASQEWIDSRSRLQQKILARMRSLGMNPVLPGYSGMLPNNASARLGVATADPGLWCGFRRPSFLAPDSPRFAEIADIYYEELTRLYGKSPYYSADPFHEGGNTDGVDMRRSGESILGAMRRCSGDAVWVVQAWQDNPRRAMIDSLPSGSVHVLDLYSEKRPQWGDPSSEWYRPDGFGRHDWLYCMLLNFGGNTGLHGRIDRLTDGYRAASASSRRLRGIGATAEGIENNPVMYELLFDLPWTVSPEPSHSPIDSYLKARYGLSDSIPEPLSRAWRTLCATVYNAPVSYPGEGTVESIICARPSWDIKGASTWGNATLFYSPDSTALAASAYAEAAGPQLMENPNFVYDLTDITRQALSDKAYALFHNARSAHLAGHRSQAIASADSMLRVILQVDSLLAGRSGFTVGEWLGQAAAAAESESQRRVNVTNAARLITVWGDSSACNIHGLKDYSHRLWHGITSELYYRRWKAFFDSEFRNAPAPDYYRMELDWIDSRADSLD